MDKIAIRKEKTSKEIVVTPDTTEIAMPVRRISINERNFVLDARELMRMICNVTQSIGEAKKSGNAYAEYTVPGLRKIRNQMVSDLSNYFGIQWKIDNNGKSIFYI